MKTSATTPDAREKSLLARAWGVRFLRRVDERGQEIIARRAEGRCARKDRAQCQRKAHCWLREQELLAALGPELCVPPAGDATLALHRRDGERCELFLAERLELAPLPVDEVVAILVAIAELVGRLHERRLVACALSPGSLCLTPVADGAYAARLAAYCRVMPLFERHQASFTLDLDVDWVHYLAPEQLPLSGREVDARADLYAIGAIAYRLLAGRPPYRDRDPREIVSATGLATHPPVKWFHSTMPAALGSIVERLLMVEPGRRYQTSSALLEDLELLLECLREGDQDPSVSLGVDDFSPYLKVSTRVIGREAILRQMGEFLNASRSSGRWLGLGGPSGVGKTSLLSAFEASQEQTLFGIGKFEQFDRKTPYSAFAGALGSAARQLLMLPEKDLERYRQALQREVGPRAALLLELVPELEIILRDAPELGALGPAETRRRFEDTLLCSLRALGQLANPFVLVLDDLQWADPASIALFEHLCEEIESLPLLLIAAYRDTELEAHPSLKPVMDRLSERSGHGMQLSVEPLPLEAIGDLIDANVGATIEGRDALVGYVYGRSSGRPLHARHALEQLYRAGRLRADERLRRWRFETSVEGTSPSVLALEQFFHVRVEWLRDETLRVLHYAACIGLRARGDVLQRALGIDAEALELAIDEGVNVGFLKPGEGTLCFAHDRALQAIAESIDDSIRSRIHFDLARAFDEATAESSSRWAFWQTVEHYDQALDCLVESEARRRVIALNCEASLRASQTNAYDATLDYARTAQSLLDTSPEGTETPLRERCAFVWGRALYLNGRFDQARKVAEDALLWCEQPEACTRIFGLLKDLLVGYFQDYELAVSINLDIARRLGLLRGSSDSLAAEVEALDEALRGRLEHEIRPRSAGDPSRSANSMRLLVDLWEASYYSGDRVANRFAVLKNVELSLEYGESSESALGYTLYGLDEILRGNIARGARFGERALEMIDRTMDAETLPKVLNLYCSYILPFREPGRNAIARFDRSTAVAQSNGSHLFGLWAAFFSVWTRLWYGESLIEARVRAEEVASFIRSTQDTKIILAFDVLLWSLGELKAEKRELLELGALEPDRILAYWRESHFLPGPTWYALLRGFSLVLQGRYEEAAELLDDDSLDTELDVVMFPLVAFPFLRASSLGLAALTRGKDAIEEALARTESDRKLVERWAAACPDGFECQRLLLDALRAWLLDSRWEASTAFELAMELGRKHGPWWVEALSFDLASQFYAAVDQNLRARSCADAAAEIYERVAATQCLPRFSSQATADAHPAGAGRSAARRSRARSAPTRSTLDEHALDAEAYLPDFEAILRASYAMSADTGRDTRIAGTMQVLRRYSGAQRGILLRGSAEGLFVVAAFERDHHSERVDAPSVGAEYTRMPRSIIRYVARNKRSSRLRDTKQLAIFGRDPYILATHPAAVLCVPYVNLGVTEAIVYLEHADRADAFDSVRDETLEVVLALSMGHLRNLDLVDNLRKEIDQRQTIEGELDTALSRLQRSNASAWIAAWEWEFADQTLRWGSDLRNVTGPFFGDPTPTRERFLELVHPDEREVVGKAFSGAFNDGRRILLVHRLVVGEGREIWVETAGEVELDANGSPIRMTGTTQNIQDRRKASAERAQLQNQVQQAQKMQALGQLTGGIAHDFNNLLTIIIANVEQAQATYDPYLLSGLLADIQVASDRAKKLIGQMLLFSRGEKAGSSPLVLADVVRECVSMLRPALPSSLALEVDIASELPRILGNTTQLQQVIINCCINARDALRGSGNLRIGATRDHRGGVCSSCHQGFEGDYVVLEIRDDGPGLAPETLERVFEPFFSTKPVGEGTGMGLSVVHGILHRDGGHIIVRSELGVGTTFEMLFPIVQQPTTLSERHKAIAPPPPVGSLQGVRALVIDDEPMVLRLEELVLRQQGCTVSAFDDPQAALQAFEADPNAFDCVLTDQTMPRLSGLDLARRISEIRELVPVVLCSGNPGSLDEEEMAAVGIRAVVEKPFSPKKVVADLAELLKR